MNISLLRTMVVLLVCAGRCADAVRLLDAANWLNNYVNRRDEYAAHTARHDGTQALAPVGWLLAEVAR